MHCKITETYKILCPILSENLKEIALFFLEETGRHLSLDVMSFCINRYPSAFIKSDSNIIAFSYTKPFAPDILEVMNLFVKKDFRNKGHGGALLKEIERQAANNYKAIIGVNSLLYPSKQEKNLEFEFYIKNQFKVMLLTEKSILITKNINILAS